MKTSTLFFIWILGNILFVFLLFSDANAEPKLPHVASCLVQDWVTIVDDGPDKATVTYYNSIDNCSSPGTWTFTAPNGISVKVTVSLGGAETSYKENVLIIPVDAWMMSFPPEEDIIDGETKKFTIMGGMS